MKWMPKKMKIAPKLDVNVHPITFDKRGVMLINPFYPKDPFSSFGKHVLTPSLALTSIAGATPPEWNVHYWDENLLMGHPPYEPFPRVVGITVHITFASRAYELADWFRARGAIVVLGGLHVQSCPDEVKKHADIIVISNGAAVWRDVLNDIERGRFKEVYTGSYQSDYDMEPVPRRDILPRECFLTTCSMIATRGCSNRCSFCYLSTKGLIMPKQCRKAYKVAKEFEESGEPYGVFTDNNLGADIPYLYRLCQALKPIKKIWSAAVCIDITDDTSLVREMALAGCTGVFIGFESLNDANLINSKKKTSRTEDYARRVKIFHDAGIQVNGSFVFGFDDDRKDVFAKTVEWIESVKLECATFHILTPYPGTPLFEKYEKEGRLLHKNWGHYDTSHAVFLPRHMTPEELEEGYKDCYKSLFSYASIWKRRPDGIFSALPYLAMSYLYKRSNFLWYFIIKHRLTAKVWKPLVEVTRLRHLHFREKLIKQIPSIVRIID